MMVWRTNANYTISRGIILTNYIELETKLIYNTHTSAYDIVTRIELETKLIYTFKCLKHN